MLIVVPSGHTKLAARALTPSRVTARKVRGKVAALDIPAEEKAALVSDAIAAWNGGLKPAYQRLHKEMVRQEAIAPTDDGVWRLPDGERYYNLLLEGYTTTKLTADEIHDIGLREAARIHDEMRDG